MFYAFTGREPFFGIVNFLEQDDAVEQEIDIHVVRKLVKHLLYGLLLHGRLTRKMYHV